MQLSDLKRLREQGKRPASGLVLIRDIGTRSSDAASARGGELIVTQADVRASWRPVAGLAAHFWPSRWERWTVPLIDRICEGRPEVLTVRDPVSDDLICVYADGQRMPLACDVDCDEAWLAAYKAVRRA